MSLLTGPEHPPWPWQQAAWRRLCRQHQARNLAHAYLFCGDSGTGRGAFIREFADLLLCAEPVKQRACRQCRSCLAGGAEHHPDLFLALPEAGKKDIGIGRIREMTEFLSRSAYSGLARTAIIPNAERLTLAAANALLKTLEEPADKAYLLLTTLSPGGLLPTIRSRCQILALPGPDPETAADWLGEQLGPRNPHTGQALRDTLEACGNRPLAALARLRAGDAAGFAALRRILLDLLYDKATAPQAAREATKIGDDVIFEQLAGISTILIRGLIEGVWQSADNRALAEALPGADEKPRLSALLAFHQQTVTARKLLAGPGNPNPQLLLESIFLHWKGQAT